MPRVFPALLLCLLLVAAMGCDKSGIHPIGTVLDPTTSCPPEYATSTWLRSMTDGSGTVIGVELLLLGWRPDDPIDQGLDTLLETTERCMARFKIWGSTTTEEHIGSVALAGDGSGTMTENLHCSFLMEPSLTILDRRGADCFNLTATGEVETTDFSFSVDTSGASDILEVTFPDESAPYRFDNHDPGDPDSEPLVDELMFRIPAGTYRYLKYNDLVANLAADPEPMTNAFDIWRAYHVALITSQARLKSFGSGGMTQFINSEATFVGMVSSAFTVVVETPLMPRTTIGYDLFEDLTGSFIGAPGGEPQITIVDLGGNGGMEGGLTFELRVDPNDTAGAITGYVSYENTLVNEGFGNGGTFDITVEGTSYDVTPLQLSVPMGMGYDPMVPGYGNFKFDVSNLDPNL